jgi:hypothetical protein
MKRVFGLFALIVLVSGCTGSPPAEQGSNLPIDSRGFLIGVVPTPRSVPETTFDDISDAYMEAGEIGEVMMVWTGENIGQYERLKSSQVVTAARVYGLRPVLTLNFATIKEVQGSGLQYVVDAPEGVAANLSDPGFRSLWVQEAESIAGEFKPEYFSLGNEINDYFYLHPEDIEAYLSLFDEAYSGVKAVSPDTKVFAVFSYNHLLDNGQWDLLEMFNTKADLIGLTTYPGKQYDSPRDIPGDYYSRIGEHADRPIAFTEIGWPSTNETQQAKYLVRFLELTRGMDIEMVNWLFLHEAEISGILESVSDPETGKVSLKKADGSENEVYGVWEELKALPIS